MDTRTYVFSSDNELAKTITLLLVRLKKEGFRTGNNGTKTQKNGRIVSYHLQQGSLHIGIVQESDITHCDNTVGGKMRSRLTISSNFPLPRELNSAIEGTIRDHSGMRTNTGEMEI